MCWSWTSIVRSANAPISDAIRCLCHDAARADDEIAKIDRRTIRTLEQLLRAKPSKAPAIAPNVECPKCAQAVLEDEGAIAGCPACGEGFAVGTAVPHVVVVIKDGSVESTLADGPVRIDVLDRDAWNCIGDAGKHDRACREHDAAAVADYRKRCRSIDKLTEYVH
jgi:hypothetical protein